MSSCFFCFSSFSACFSSFSSCFSFCCCTSSFFCAGALVAPSVFGPPCLHHRDLPLTTVLLTALFCSYSAVDCFVLIFVWALFHSCMEWGLGRQSDFAASAYHLSKVWCLPFLFCCLPFASYWRACQILCSPNLGPSYHSCIRRNTCYIVFFMQCAILQSVRHHS